MNFQITPGIVHKLRKAWRTLLYIVLTTSHFPPLILHFVQPSTFLSFHFYYCPYPKCPYHSCPHILLVCLFHIAVLFNLLSSIYLWICKIVLPPPHTHLCPPMSQNLYFSPFRKIFSVITSFRRCPHVSVFPLSQDLYLSPISPSLLCPHVSLPVSSKQRLSLMPHHVPKNTLHLFFAMSPASAFIFIKASSTCISMSQNLYLFTHFFFFPMSSCLSAGVLMPAAPICVSHAL